MAISSQHNTI